MGFCKEHQHAFVNVCSDCVLAGLSNGIRSRNGDKFVYSAYWHVWSRVLSPLGNLEVGQVEVDLTCVSDIPERWSRVAAINIRAHRTTPDRFDMCVDVLPASVFHKMDAMLGHDRVLLERLLHEDLLPQIDWYKYRKTCNGGAPFAAITK